MVSCIHLLLKSICICEGVYMYMYVYMSIHTCTHAARRKGSCKKITDRIRKLFVYLYCQLIIHLSALSIRLFSLSPSVCKAIRRVLVLLLNVTGHLIELRLCVFRVETTYHVRRGRLEKMEPATSISGLFQETNTSEYRRTKLGRDKMPN